MLLFLVLTFWVESFSRDHNLASSINTCHALLSPLLSQSLHPLYLTQASQLSNIVLPTHSITMYIYVTRRGTIFSNCIPRYCLTIATATALVLFLQPRVDIASNVLGNRHAYLFLRSSFLPLLVQTKLIACSTIRANFFSFNIIRVATQEIQGNSKEKQADRFVIRKHMV